MAKRVSLYWEVDGGERYIRNQDGFIGFSWTCLFFSWIVPLCRGDFLSAIVLAVLWFCGLFLIVNIFMAFFYNKYHLNQLKKAGWRELNS